MRLRVLPLVVILAAAASFGQSPVGSIVLSDPTGSVSVSKYTGTESHEIIEYKDGEDGTSHTRPGNHKPGKMTVTKDWSNTSEFFTRLVQDCLSGGMLARKSMSVVFLNRSGDEVLRHDFAQFGDTDVRFPATGSLSSDPFAGIQVSGTAYLHSQGIIHRDLAARNVLLPKGFQVNVSDFGLSRSMPVLGTSPLSVHVTTGDLDGDGIPDVVARIAASRFTMEIDGVEAPFIQKWDSDTDAAGAQGVQCLRHFSFLWFTPDGSDYRVDLDATLISALPLGSTIEVECAAEAVKFSREALKGTTK